MIDMQEMTIAQAHNGFRSGQFTAHNLCIAFLDRVAKLDKSGPRINSTMALSTTAVDEAAALDAYFMREGKFKGSLHGIPVLVKDQVRPPHRIGRVCPWLTSNSRLIQKAS